MDNLLYETREYLTLSLGTICYLYYEARRSLYPEEIRSLKDIALNTFAGLAAPYLFDGNYVILAVLCVCWQDLSCLFCPEYIRGPKALVANIGSLSVMFVVFGHYFALALISVLVLDFLWMCVRGWLRPNSIHQDCVSDKTQKALFAPRIITRSLDDWDGMLYHGKV